MRLRSWLHLRAERRRAAVRRWHATEEQAGWPREALDGTFWGQQALVSLAVADLLDALAEAVPVGQKDSP